MTMIAKIKSIATPDNIIAHTELHGYTNETGKQVINLVQKMLVPIELRKEYEEEGFVKIGRSFRKYVIMAKVIAFKLETFDEIVFAIMRSKTKTLESLVKKQEDYE